MMQVGANSYSYNTTYSILGGYSYYIWTDDINNNQNKSAIYQLTIFAPMAEKVSEVAPAPANLLLYAGISAVIVIIIAVSFVVVLKRRKKLEGAV